MKRVRRLIIKLILLCLILFLLGTGVLLFWVSTAQIPSFDSFEDIKVAQSTKIYDRTGETLLFDIHQNIKRTVVPFEDMGINIKNATVAIEDSEFYQHRGIRVKAILRAILVNLSKRKLSQGGSTITQQIIKNTLLTSERTITRKLKEWILSLKIERVMSKEDILEIYLNEAPYGGNIYGVDEASREFFGKKPTELTLAEASYLAAIPKAPTYYSPYGENKDQLNNRKNLVLTRMLELNFINEEEYQNAKNEVVEFLSEQPIGIQAPHFVFFIREYLEEKYGKEVVEEGGLRVITTLDYNLQKKAEEIVLKYALENEEKYNASNASLVAINPKTGEILVMVGSRNYFDEKIDGKFNVATAQRQPGSSFKPFVYATAFKKGYTPNSIVFDVPTEFFVGCDSFGKALPGYNQNRCYHPENYDGLYKGPTTLRDGLAQSRNVPSVKLLYLVGINDSIKTAFDMGIKTLTDPNRYGLTLVLGGGEVKLLDMTSAYGVFATGGVRHPYQSILRVEDADGLVLEEYQDKPVKVLEKNIALLISDILSDNEARAPLFGSRSFMYFEGRAVAGKTGTTDKSRDGWLIGYTPSVVVGVWSGNNDNSPMKKGSSVSGDLWHDFMQEALNNLPIEGFEEPEIQNNLSTLKPVLRGVWLGGESFLIDTISNKLATEYTPLETVKEVVITNVHTILQWVDKKNPLGPPSEDPTDDSQFFHWEEPVQQWWELNKNKYPIISLNNIPTDYDNVHTLENKPVVTIIKPGDSIIYNLNEKITVETSHQEKYPIQRVDFFVNNIYLGSDKTEPFSLSFAPVEISNIQPQNEVRVVAYDGVFNNSQTTVGFRVSF